MVKRLIFRSQGNMMMQQAGNQNQKSTLLIKVFLFIALTCLLNACAITPGTIVQTPTSAKPVAPTTAIASGAIYSTSSHRPLFEDRRARFTGDILTINIAENTSAKKASSSAAGKAGSVNASAAVPLGLPIGLNKEAISINANSAIDYDDSADANASNNFNGSISVTVLEVLANGNLMVSGEKQIALDKGTEFVRFSGVVNPDDIVLGNFVPSTKVADARIEYRSNSKLDASQVASILTRFFLSFIPL
jgi:flagellar L-ring protein FlgH